MEDEEGNVSVEMTLRYAHLSPDHKRAAVEVLGRRMDTYMDTTGRKKERAKNRHPEIVDNTVT